MLGQRVGFQERPGVADGRGESLAPFAVEAEHVLRIGGLRIGEEVADGGVFDDAAFMEDEDAVAVIGDDAEFLGDEEDGAARLLHGAPHLVEELGLDRDVEAGGGFVRDEELRT